MSSPIIQLFLQPNIYPNIVVKQKIVYRNVALDLTDEERQQLESALPEFWHTSKDRLVRFDVFEDDTYFCERYKDYFDYNTRETNQKFYLFDSGNDAQSKQLHVFLLEQYSKIKLKRIENLYDAVTESIGNISYVKYSLLEARDTLLKDSDYVMMSDYPISEEEKQQWIEYRQKLRDVTDQQAWKDNDLMNIEMPLGPRPKDQLFVYREQIASATSILAPELMEMSIEQAEAQGLVEECLKNIAAVTVKYEILRGLSALRLPILDIKYTQSDGNLINPTDYFNQTISNLEELGSIYSEMEMENQIPNNWWDAATTNLNQTIENLNNKLKEYDISFTINDILNTIIQRNIEQQMIIEENSEGM